MATINSNYLKLKAGYLFPEIARRVQAFAAANPDANIIRLGIGDVTEPLPLACREAMIKAVQEMGDRSSFKGYGPEQGYAWLREKIAVNDFQARGCEISADEIFISDGSKCDTGNILDIQIPAEKVDLIYLCFPNNPTGATATKEHLTAWVNYARANGSIIFFDAAYEAFITDASLPHSIYEIEGARQCAIEFRSFSKNAGFTGTRCALTVVPQSLMAKAADGTDVQLWKLWNRRQSTKFNGVSYIVQRGAEAVYSPEGQAQVEELVKFYLQNATIIREKLTAAGLEVHGGVNAPYVWVKTPQGLSSWDFFDKLLHTCNVVGTPGSGFGAAGEGYFRLSAFNSRANVEAAMERIIDKFQG